MWETVLLHSNSGSKGLGGMPRGACPSTQSGQAILHFGPWWEWEAEMLEEAAIGRPPPTALPPAPHAGVVSLGLGGSGHCQSCGHVPYASRVPRGFYHAEALQSSVVEPFLIGKSRRQSPYVKWTQTVYVWGEWERVRVVPT